MREFVRNVNPAPYDPTTAPAPAKRSSGGSSKVVKQELPEPKPLRAIPSELTTAPTAAFDPNASREQVMKKLAQVRETLPVPKKEPDLVSQILGSKLLTEWLKKCLTAFVEGKVVLPAPPTRLQLANEQMMKHKDRQFEREVLRERGWKLVGESKIIETYAVIGPNGAEVQSSSLEFIEKWLVEKCWTDEKTAKLFAIAVRQHLAYKVLPEYSMK